MVLLLNPFASENKIMGRRCRGEANQGSRNGKVRGQGTAEVNINFVLDPSAPFSPTYPVSFLFSLHVFITCPLLLCPLSFFFSLLHVTNAGQRVCILAETPNATFSLSSPQLGSSFIPFSSCITFSRSCNLSKKSLHILKDRWSRLGLLKGFYLDAQRMHEYHESSY